MHIKIHFNNFLIDIVTILAIAYFSDKIFRLYPHNPRILPEWADPIMKVEELVIPEEFRYSQIEGHKEKTIKSLKSSLSSSSSLRELSVESKNRPDNAIATKESFSRNMNTLSNYFQAQAQPNNPLLRSIDTEIFMEEREDIDWISQPLLVNMSSTRETTQVSNNLRTEILSPDHHLTPDHNYSQIASDVYTDESSQRLPGHKHVNKSEETAAIEGNIETPTCHESESHSTVPLALQQIYRERFTSEKYQKAKAELNKLRLQREIGEQKKCGGNVNNAKVAASTSLGPTSTYIPLLSTFAISDFRQSCPRAPFLVPIPQPENSKNLSVKSQIDSCMEISRRSPNTDSFVVAVESSSSCDSSSDESEDVNEIKNEYDIDVVQGKSEVDNEFSVNILSDHQSTEFQFDFSSQIVDNSQHSSQRLSGIASNEPDMLKDPTVTESFVVAVDSCSCSDASSASDDGVDEDTLPSACRNNLNQITPSLPQHSTSLVIPAKMSNDAPLKGSTELNIVDFGTSSTYPTQSYHGLSIDNGAPFDQYSSPSLIEANTPICFREGVKAKYLNGKVNNYERDHPEGDLQDIPCCMCSDVDADDLNPMVFCEGQCGEWVHIECYGLSCPPSGLWMCEGCADKSTKRCYICSKSGGMLRRSTCGHWTHPICVMFTSELTVNDDQRPDNLACIDTERYDLVCTLCRNNEGACVQCSHTSCLAAVHPYCAFKGDFQMTLNESSADDISGCPTLECKVYCFLHFNMYSVDRLLSCRDRAYLERLKNANSSSHCWNLRDGSSSESQIFANTPLVERCRSGQKKSFKRLRKGGFSRGTKPLSIVKKDFDAKMNSEEGKSMCTAEIHSSRNFIEHRKKEKGVKDFAERHERRQKRLGMTLIEQQAFLSGSDSGDDSNIESQQLSGNFINDGEYTQESTNGDDCVGKSRLFISVLPKE